MEAEETLRSSSSSLHSAVNNLRFAYDRAVLTLQRSGVAREALKWVQNEVFSQSVPSCEDECVAAIDRMDEALKALGETSVDSRAIPPYQRVEMAQRLDDLLYCVAGLQRALYDSRAPHLSQPVLLEPARAVLQQFVKTSLWRRSS
jgi:hypothetical protein